jgi:serine/threonine-protein kinase
MPNDSLDLAFARHVRQIGLITSDQLNAALQAQSRNLQEGKPISVSDAMVQLGLLTPTQKDSLEKKVREQQAGVQQLGPYKLMKKLGEGGMGAVYLALDSATQRHVAVKVLPRHFGASAEFVKRFRRESEAATQLKHPNIIGAFAAGEDLGYHYYAMEYCDGMSLDAILAAEGPLPAARAIDITLQAAKGLQYAHDQGIIHRDIKPSNIIVTKDGLAKILDLGLSKNLEDNTVSFKTVTGAVLGTPHYISPEQAQGERNVDGRSDIYSLGASLYHLLSGRVPFDGQTALEILSKHVNTVLPNPQDLREGIPDALVQVLQRMMAKEPNDRYPDCGALIADLVEVNAGRTPKTKLISAALTTIAPSRKAPLKKRPSTIRRAAPRPANKSALIAGIAGAVAVVVVVVVFLSGGSDMPAPPAVAKPPASGKAAEPAKTSFDAESWEKSLEGLPPEARLKAVISRLRDLNAGYDGSERHETGHGRITRLELSHVALRDLSPLRGLPQLAQLELSGTSVSDLTPLRNARIVSLACSGMKSADLASIRAMKELKILSLKSTPVRDLSPLAGMDLWQLNLKGCSAADLSALRQLKLRELLCDFDAKRDAAILRSMPDLEKINDLPAEEFWLKERSSEPAAASGPEAQVRAVVARLKERNPVFDGQPKFRVEDGEVAEFQSYAFGVTDLSPLSELRGLKRLWFNGLWDPAEQREVRSPLKDLRPLRGLPLVLLFLDHTEIEDLSPLQGMKLQGLNATSTPLSDLLPLRGLPLKKLEIGWTRVRDLSPLEGMELDYLDIRSTAVTNFSPLRNVGVKVLLGPLNPKQDAALVASIKGLEAINGGTVAEFLKSSDVPPPQPQPPATPRPVEAGPWKNAIDLIALIDPARDTVRGNWKKENGRVIAEFGENAVLRLPYEPPAEYDFRIVFSRTRGTCAIAQFLQHEGRGFFWEMGGYGNVNAGFALIGGRGSRENPTNAGFVPRDGVNYTSVIQVRRDRVTALVDDKKISEWLPSMGALSADRNWGVDVPNLLGLGNCESLTTFDVVQVREVTGKGRIRTTLTTPPEPAFIQSVGRLAAPEQLKRVVDKLKELNPHFDPGQARSRIEGDRVVEFGTSTQKIQDLWPVRAFPYLRRLDLGDDRNVGIISDLSCLKGMKIQELILQNTRVSDLSPLAQLPLSSLDLQGTRVTALGALRGTKITTLVLNGTAVSDLSPLKEVPLQTLSCERVSTNDFSPLKSIRSLKTINDQPAAEFLKSQKDGWTAIFDGRSLDFLRNASGWKLDKGALVNDPSVNSAAQTQFEFENGELRFRFEVKGSDALTFRVRQNDNGACGVLFDGAQLRALEGKPHELVITCRGTQVAATLDGKPHPLSESKAQWRGCLQFNSTNGSLRISSIDYRP